MDFHLERSLRLLTEPEHKGLYDWAINEIDSNGRPVGRDQIPWPWALDFVATSCVLSEQLAVEPRLYFEGNTPPPQPEIIQRQNIMVRLRPGRGDGDYGGETRYSMFGTDRAIEDFRLQIYSSLANEEQGICRAWGSVSYTSEIDFRDETSDDCIMFHLGVNPETFSRYAAMILSGQIDEIHFRVGGVAGVYSEWSPTISTRRAKVLTCGREQKLLAPPGVQFEPPRLGHVASFDLCTNRLLVLQSRKPAPAPMGHAANAVEGNRIEHDVPAPAMESSRDLPLLLSLRRAVWVIVLLLALIFITALPKI